MAIKRAVKIAAASVALSLLISGCSIEFIEKSFDDNNKKYSSVSRSETSRKTSKSISEKSYVVTDTKERQEYSMKKNLNELQTEIYNRIVYDIEDYALSFTFENIEQEDFKNAYYAVLEDHPEFFWIGKNFRYHMKTVGDYTVVNVDPDLMSEDVNVIKVYKEKFERVANNIITEAKKKENTYEKVLYVHDYIVDHTDYDSETLDLIKNDENEGLLNASTAYGCLVEGKAICSGYSAAFQYLMEMLDIDCYRVSGTRVSESGPHQWNFLLLDGEYYYIDCTWDDPITSDGQKRKTYEYFLISDGDIFLTHKLDGEREVPQCAGRRYNYYVYNDLFFDEYDFRYIEEVALRDPFSNIITVKFRSSEYLREAVEDLMTNQMIFTIPHIKGNVSYSESASECILTIRINNS